MLPSHSFWSVLGPARAPKFGSGSHAARGGIDPGRPATDVGEERAANPFLRVDAIRDDRMPWPEGMAPSQNRVDRFAALRLAKDHFRA